MMRYLNDAIALLCGKRGTLVASLVASNASVGPTTPNEPLVSCSYSEPIAVTEKIDINAARDVLPRRKGYTPAPERA